MIKSVQTISKLIDLNTRAIPTSHFCNDPEGEIFDILDLNRSILQEVNKHEFSNFLWHEQYIKCIYKEFIRDLAIKNNIENFGIVKINYLKPYKDLWKTKELKAEFKNNFKPLLDTFENFRKYNDSIESKANNACFILTALPLEFRAIVRRLDFISSVKTIPFNDNSTIINKDLKINKAFDYAMNSDYDLSFPSNATKKDKEVKQKFQRPYLLFVEGFFIYKAIVKKVVIALPSSYGWDRSRYATEKIISHYRSPSYFNEAIVCGVSGTLAERSEVNYGDLIISNKIAGYDNYKPISTNNDKVTNDLSFTDFKSWPCKKTKESKSNNWTPSLLVEKPPELQDNINILKSGFISTSGVLDVDNYKNIFKEKFFNEQLSEGYLGVEMEGYGVIKYFRDNNIDINIQVIKSVSDYCDTNKTKIYQPYCADVASSFVYDYLTKKI